MKRIAGLILQTVTHNIRRHDTLQRFMLTTDSVSVAIEVPVYLTPEDLPHLFERFWRKDPARSSQLNSGLGLALAKAYAQSLGMKLQAGLNHAEIVFTLSGATACNDANG